MVSIVGTPTLLVCPVQHYAWGSGSNGVVSQISHDQSGKPCAELWMGTHPSAPSRLHDGSLLSEHLGKSLPFLFKVLSVNTALSIQAHPDRVLARKLHHKDPKNYPDDNHKPEMAIAITPFEALCSFRVLEEISAFWTDYPELQLLTPFNKDIRQMFGNVMHAERERILLVAEKVNNHNAPIVSLFKRLWTQYPNDVGCFCVFFLNYLKLEPNEAIFLAANEPHAYLSGDCMECMAASDNVVRAGLTPKHRDLDTLLAMLTFKQCKPADLIIKPKKDLSGLSLYNAPVDEFVVSSSTICSGDSMNICIKKDSIVIFLAGEGQINSVPFQRGSIFYLTCANYSIKNNGNSPDCLLYIASSAN